MVATAQLFATRASTAERPYGGALLTPGACPPPPWPGMPQESWAQDNAVAWRVARMVEQHVIPRLVAGEAAIDAAGGRAGIAASIAISPACPVATPRLIATLGARAEDLADLLLHGTAGAAQDFVAASLAEGHGVAGIHLYLLAPAARCLGTLWDNDLAAFAEVTTALSQLQRILRHVGPNPAPVPRPPRANRDVLLVAPPGAQHTFGMSMVQGFFERAAWHVQTAAPRGDLELAALVRNHRFAVTGFSVGCAQQLDGVQASILAVRRASRNRHIVIMVGGPALIARPDHAATLGADAMALDGEQAVQQAESLLPVSAPRG